MVEHARCDVALVRRQRLHRLAQVRSDDRLRTAELVERLAPQNAGASTLLRVPEPLHDELEIRRLDGAGLPLGGGLAVELAQQDATDLHLVEHRLEELLLDLDRRPVRELVVPLERADDSCPGGGPVEPLQSQIVAEDVRDEPGEYVELGEGVLPQREQNVDAEIRPRHDLGERRGEGGLRPGRRTSPRTGPARGRGRRRQRPRAPPGRRQGACPGGGGSLPSAAATARSRVPAASPAQESWTTTTASGASERRRRTTPARSTELLPTPSGP